MMRPARKLLMDLDGVVRHWPGHGRARGEQAAGLPTGAIRELGYGREFTLANLGCTRMKSGSREWLSCWSSGTAPEPRPRCRCGTKTPANWTARWSPCSGRSALEARS